MTSQEEARVTRETILWTTLMDVEEVTPYPVPDEDWESVAKDLLSEFEHDEIIRERKKEIAESIMSAEWARRFRYAAQFAVFLNELPPMDVIAHYMEQEEDQEYGLRATGTSCRIDAKNGMRTSEIIEAIGTVKADDRMTFYVGENPTERIRQVPISVSIDKSRKALYLYFASV